MADVTESFLRGRSLAQAEQEHTSILADSQLRQKVLKHQIDAMKLDDQLRAQELVKGRADLGLLGGGEDGGSDATKPATANLKPSQVGGIRGLFLQQELDRLNPAGAASDATGAADTSTPDATATASGAQDAAGRIVGPAAAGTPPLVVHSNDTVPDTHTELQNGQAPTDYGTADHPGMTKAGHVWIPALSVPELGIQVPGMWYSAKAAAEESARRAIALERAKRQPVRTRPGDILFGTDNAGNTVELGRNNNPAARTNVPLNQQYADALKAGNTEEAKRVLQAIKDTRPAGTSLGAMLIDAKRSGNTQEANLIRSVMGDEASARRDPAVEDARLRTEQRQLYTEDVATGFRKQADGLKAWTAKYPAGKIDDTVPDPPEYEPPTFTDWLKDHPVGATNAQIAGGKKPPTAPAPAAPKAAAPATSAAGQDTLPADTAAGDYVMRAGKRYQVKGVTGGKVSLEPANKTVAKGDIVHYQGARYKVADIVNGQAKLEPVAAP